MQLWQSWIPNLCWIGIQLHRKWICKSEEKIVLNLLINLDRTAESMIANPFTMELNPSPGPEMGWGSALSQQIHIDYDVNSANLSQIH